MRKAEEGMSYEAYHNPMKGVDSKSKEGRAALAKMVMKLFDHWKLSPKEQTALLGLTEGSRMSLSRYRRGEPLRASRDLLDRVANLLAIHQSLRILFPQNLEIAYNWPSTPNRAFRGQSPVEIITKDGFFGLLVVRRYLDFQISR